MIVKATSVIVLSSILVLAGCAGGGYDERNEIWSKDYNPAMRPVGTSLFQPKLLNEPFYDSGGERAAMTVSKQ